jgi:hypothetical protein
MFKTNSNSNSNSYPFVPGQNMITFNLEGNAVTDDDHNEDLLTDMSYQVVAKMQDCIDKKDLDKYKQLYTEEYISNPVICDFFKFEDNSPYETHSIYSLCTCSNRHDEPSKIHTYMYVRACNCVEGKRYLAYLAAFNALTEGIYYDTNPKYLIPLNKPITPICQFLLDDGPLDLTYQSMSYV